MKTTTKTAQTESLHFTNFGETVDPETG